MSGDGREENRCGHLTGESDQALKMRIVNNGGAESTVIVVSFAYVLETTRAYCTISGGSNRKAFANFVIVVFSIYR